MDKVTKKTQVRNVTLFGGLCTIFILYIGSQFVYAYGSLRTNGFQANVFQSSAVPPPYIVFLASLLTPIAADINRSCLWKLFRDRNIMWQLETMLEDPDKYEDLKRFIRVEFDVCILKSESVPVPAYEFTTVPEIVKEEHPDCFIQPWDLKFGADIDITKPPPALEVIENEYPEMEPGGLYPGPSYCKRPRHSTVIIIPFRNRDIHLRYWLHYTIETLIMQQIRFKIIVVEQEEQGVFNKGQLMNTGFKWAISDISEKWDCFVFHDVDMLSEIYGTLYKCADENLVVHLSPYIDKFNYTTAPKIGVTVGGAVGFSQWQYRAVNGYSNVYWGWGGEDDDMNVRIRLTGLRRARPKQPFGRFKMIPHGRDNGNPTNLIRHKLLKSARTRMAVDGLSNLATKIQTVKLYRSHTRLVVEVNRNTRPPPDMIPKYRTEVEALSGKNKKALSGKNKKAFTDKQGRRQPFIPGRARRG